MPWFFAALRSASFTDVIAQISGALAQKIPGEVIVDVGGVGYQIFIPLNVFYRLPEIGAPVHLQIYTHVREDALQLFGFSDFAEKQVFLLLIEYFIQKLPLFIRNVQIHRRTSLSNKAWVRIINNQVKLSNTPRYDKRPSTIRAAEVKGCSSDFPTSIMWLTNTPSAFR